LPQLLQGIGIDLLATKPTAQIVKYAQLAEKAGIDEFWLGENYHWFRRYGEEPRSAMTTAAAIALATSRIRLGLGIVSVYTRHPAILAMESYSLSELSQGRFTLGLGAAKMGVVHMGFDLQNPLRTHRECIQLIRALLTGDEVNYSGEVFKLESPASEDHARPNYRIPIVLGVTGPKLLQLAGETCDGLILPTLTTPAYVTYAMEQVQVGARRSGKSLEDFRVGATLISAVDKDGAAARDAVRKILATYFTNKLVNIKNDILLQSASITNEEIQPIADAVLRNDYDHAMKLVTDDMIDRTVVAGTVEEVCERLEDYAKAGLQIPLFVLWGNVQEGIKLLGSEVRSRLVKAAS